MSLLRRMEVNKGLGRDYQGVTTDYTKFRVEFNRKILPLKITSMYRLRGEDSNIHPVCKSEQTSIQVGILSCYVTLNFNTLNEVTIW